MACENHKKRIRIQSIVGSILAAIIIILIAIVLLNSGKGYKTPEAAAQNLDTCMKEKNEDALIGKASFYELSVLRKLYSKSGSTSVTGKVGKKDDFANEESIRHRMKQEMKQMDWTWSDQMECSNPQIMSVRAFMNHYGDCLESDHLKEFFEHTDKIAVVKFVDKTKKLPARKYIFYYESGHWYYPLAIGLFEEKRLLTGTLLD